MEYFTREAQHLGEEIMTNFRNSSFTLCGCGALGSILLDDLVRMGAGTQGILIVDDDTVEEVNVSTQIFFRDQHGIKKTIAAQDLIYRTSGITPEVLHRRITSKNARLLDEFPLILECFDAGRKGESSPKRLVYETVNSFKRKIDCLHLGMSPDGYGEAVWQEHYTPPTDLEEDDPCEIAVGRILIHAIVNLAVLSLIEYYRTGLKISYSVTSKDLIPSVIKVT